MTDLPLQPKDNMNQQTQMQERTKATNLNANQFYEAHSRKHVYLTLGTGEIYVTYIAIFTLVSAGGGGKRGLDASVADDRNVLRE